jgi:hypothetical protein
MKILDEIRGRFEAATPGPWRWDEEYGDANDTGLALTNDAGAEIIGAYNHHCCSFRDDPSVKDTDAEFIAHAPADMAALLRAVDAVQHVAKYLDGLADGDQHYAALFRNAVTAALEGKA